MKSNRKPPKPTPWKIPDEYRLPDTVAGIERGRQPRLKQGELFDSSTMSRLRAIKRGERDEKSR